MYDINTVPPEPKDRLTQWLSVVILALLALVVLAQIGIAAGWISPGWRP